MSVNTDLVFAEGEDQRAVDVVDDEAEGDDDDIFGCSCTRAVQNKQNAGHILNNG